MELLNANVATLKRRPRLLILFLALLAATPPLTTDMYLAAIPRIAEEWSTSVSRVNLSLVLWFVAFSVGLLFWGLFSDRIGRRPIIMLGTLSFMVASFLCSRAQTVDQLIFFRILQGISAAAPSAMSLAICRDCYEGKERQRALAWIGIILLLAPMIAPFIGAMILRYAAWPHIFITQAALGVLMTLGAYFFYKETIGSRETGALRIMFSAYGRLAHNSNYLLATLTMAFAIAPGFAFVGFSTIVYLDIYAISSTTFAALFAVNALSLMLGALFCTKLLGHYRDSTLIAAALGGGALSGTLLLLLGWSGYSVFAALMALYSFSFGMTRPLANNLILEQVDRDIGTASSMIIFIQFVVGAGAMAIATAPWGRPLLVFGLMVSVIPGIVLLIWLRIHPRFYQKRHSRKVVHEKIKTSSV